MDLKIYIFKKNYRKEKKINGLKLKKLLQNIKNNLLYLKNNLKNLVKKNQHKKKILKIKKNNKPLKLIKKKMIKKMMVKKIKKLQNKNLKNKLNHNKLHNNQLIKNNEQNKKLLQFDKTIPFFLFKKN